MLRLPRALYDRIIAHCQREYPKEACGMLAGTGAVFKHVQQVFEMLNVDCSPISYSFDPNEHLHAQEAMRLDGLALLAIYHSHTASDAYPSPVDIARASEPGVALLMPDVSYVLISLKDRQHPDIKNYLIRDGRVIPDDLQFVD